MKKSAYQIEHERSQMATQGKIGELKRTYSHTYPEIPDLNTSPFWNERLNNRTSLSQQDGMTQHRARIVAKFLPQSVRSLLDIGIGPGWIEELIEKRNITLNGTDISDKTIKNIKKRFNGKFWIESIYDLHSKNGVYDAVLLLEVLEHIPPSKNLKVLQNIKSVLKKQGYFILSVPTNEGLESMSDNPNGHVRMYTVPLIRAELEMSGFKIIKLETISAFKRYYTLKSLISRIWRNRWKPNNIIILAQK